MGIFSRIKNVVRTKANAAVDRAISPEKELELAIAELEEQRGKALEELVSYKASAKQMERDIERHAEKAAAWEKRAMLAVKSGDDEAAREALREKKRCEAEAASIKRDRDEAAGYAIELNKSRKQAETKLRILKLKKGTMATQLAAARSGRSVLGDDELFERFERAGQAIDDDAVEAEVQAAMDGEELDAADFDRKLVAAGADPGDVGGEDALAALKAKMKADRERKKLGE